MATSNDRAILDCIINPMLPTDEFGAHDVAQDDTADAGDAETVKKAKEFEKQGVIFAESGRMDHALEMFGKAIDCSPMWASAYNNRAQALRLLKRNEEAMNDLDRAIELSHGRGKAACQAYCQRAMLHHYTGNEDLAFMDWESASNLGSQFAKNQLTQKNPYAALCNKMLHDVFKNLRQGTETTRLPSTHVYQQ